MLFPLLAGIPESGWISGDAQYSFSGFFAVCEKFLSYIGELGDFLMSIPDGFVLTYRWTPSGFVPGIVIPYPFDVPLGIFLLTNGIAIILTIRIVKFLGDTLPG